VARVVASARGVVDAGVLLLPDTSASCLVSVASFGAPTSALNSAATLNTSRPADPGVPLHSNFPPTIPRTTIAAVIPARSCADAADAADILAHRAPCVWLACSCRGPADRGPCSITAQLCTQ
jgi:hypothetical protein